jgi:hypothetical protein
MRTKLLISALTILFSLISFHQIAKAHPWGGLVVNEDGNIYFTFTCPIVDDHHYACVWKLDTEGNLTQVLKSQNSPSDIILARSLNNQIYAAERSGQSPNYRNILWRLDAQVEPPNFDRVNSSDNFHIQTYSVADSATLYFARDRNLYKIKNQSTVIEIETGHSFRRIDLLSFDNDGNLYLVADNNLYKQIDNEFELIAQSLRKENPPNIPFRGANILFDMCVDENGSVYLAYYGNREILKVERSGEISSIVTAEGPWSPSGIDIYNGELYILESTIGDGAWWKFWQRNDDLLIPRVRKVDVDGKVSTLYEYQPVD